MLQYLMGQVLAEARVQVRVTFLKEPIREPRHGPLRRSAAEDDVDSAQSQEQGHGLHADCDAGESLLGQSDARPTGVHVFPAFRSSRRHVV